MKCTVIYQTWEEIKIPDEIISTSDKKLITQEVYNQIPTCLSVKEVQDKNKNCLVDGW